MQELAKTAVTELGGRGAELFQTDLSQQRPVSRVGAQRDRQCHQAGRRQVAPLSE
jgi:hypothetical protein